MTIEDILVVVTFLLLQTRTIDNRQSYVFATIDRCGEVPKCVFWYLANDKF